MTKAGGDATLAKYGREHFSRIALLPCREGKRRGRPTRAEAAAKAWDELPDKGKGRGRFKGKESIQYRTTGHA